MLTERKIRPGARHPHVPMIGLRFGRLVVLSVAGCNSEGRYYYKCRCDCGKLHTTQGKSLRKGYTKSCGCLQQEVRARNGGASATHGLSRTRAYDVWRGMMRRCYDRKCRFYYRYGGRGITVCERWHDLQAFLADMGQPPKATHLDRINNDGNYEPSNCRWVDRVTNARNKCNNHILTVHGVSQTLAAWAEQLGMKVHTLIQRLRNGWSAEEAVETPVRLMRRAAS